MELQVPQWMCDLCSFLKSEEQGAWQWFSSLEAKSDYADSLRMDLLKSTYRLGESEHAELYLSGNEALVKLSLSVPLTLYQSQSSGEASAALYYLEGEAHIVFFGNILELLTAVELKSVLAHELAHYHLWQESGGDYLIADRLLNAMANHSQAENSQIQTAQRYRLLTEIYADRGSLFVLEDLDPVVSSLVKIHSGIKQASASDYLQQAEEIFDAGKIKSAGVTHPEAFIRARSLQLYQESSESLDRELELMIGGEVSIDELDLLQQAQLTLQTKEFVKEIISAKWLYENEVYKNRLTLYCDSELSFQGVLPTGQYLKDYGNEGLHKYFVYLLLDFVAINEDDRPALALHCLAMAEKYGMAEFYEKALLKELAIKKTDWRSWQQKREEILAEVQA